MRDVIEDRDEGGCVGHGLVPIAGADDVKASSAEGSGVEDMRVRSLALVRRIRKRWCRLQ